MSIASLEIYRSKLRTDPFRVYAQSQASPLSLGSLKALSRSVKSALRNIDGLRVGKARVAAALANLDGEGAAYTESGRSHP